MSRKRRWLLCIVLIAGTAAAGVFAWRELDRRDLDRRVQRALAALREDGSIEVVRETIDRLQGRTERAGDLSLLEAGVLLREGNPRAALRTLNTARLGLTHEPWASLMQGEVYLALGNLAEAVEEFREATQVDPDLAGAHRGLAVAYRQLGAFHPSIVELEHVVRIEPQQYQAYWLIGSTYASDVKHYPKASKFLRKALERNPPEPHRSSIRRELAQCVLLAGGYAEVVQLLEPSHEEPLDQLMLAEAHYKLGNSDEAQRLVTQVEQTQPDLHGVLMLGAVLAIERGDARSAVPRLKKILERDAHDMVARHHLSMAYHSLGDSKASKEEADRMVASRALYRRSDELRREAIERPTDLKVRHELADICEKLGNTAEAARWRESAERVRQTGPADPQPSFSELSGARK